MNKGAKKLFDAYNAVRGAEIYLTEFGNGYFFGLERWKREGMPQNVDYARLFFWDENGKYVLGGMTGDNILYPPYDDAVISDDGEYLVRKDGMGRVIKFFKNGKLCYMPEYIGYCVSDKQTWLNDVSARLDASSPARYEKAEITAAKALEERARGTMISHEIDGGFMYLRDLLGPQNLLTTFFDDPELIRDCMEKWLEVHDALLKKYQSAVAIDELFIKEDICYKTSSLISPAMIEEFLFPYYEKLFSRAKKRNGGRKLYFGADSDGHIESVLPLYRAIGVTVFGPFEVAAGCDVVKIGEKYPDITLSGGFDKRILAKDETAIENELMRIIPPMKERGGYIPTCDHGVPEDVPYNNYLYFRKRLKELSK